MYLNILVQEQLIKLYIFINLFQLAEAGFYYVGSKLEPDAVQCFLCDKQLDGWEENDDPWSEHLGHSKGCTFAQLRMTENELTLNQMHKIKEELVMRQAKKIFDEQIKVYSESLQDIKKLLNV